MDPQSRFALATDNARAETIAGVYQARPHLRPLSSVKGKLLVILTTYPARSENPPMAEKYLAERWRFSVAYARNSDPRYGLKLFCSGQTPQGTPSKEFG